MHNLDNPEPIMFENSWTGVRIFVSQRLTDLYKGNEKMLPPN